MRQHFAFKPDVTEILWCPIDQRALTVEWFRRYGGKTLEVVSKIIC